MINRIVYSLYQILQILYSHYLKDFSEIRKQMRALKRGSVKIKKGTKRNSL